MSLSSELESHCLCASLFTIFFEPRMSVVQGKLYKTFLTMSIERLNSAAPSVAREPLTPGAPASGVKGVGRSDLLCCACTRITSFP